MTRLVGTVFGGLLLFLISARSVLLPFNPRLTRLSYTAPMSTPAPSGSVADKALNHVQDFWQRVSEGRAVEDLWSQFAADARSSYGFYGKDVDWKEIDKLPAWKRPFPILKQFFWALLNKLTPARRVLLLVAVAMLFVSGIKIHYKDQFALDFNFEFVAALLFLLLLSLELADKVIMKRDLEIAREIQSWLVPSEPPAIPSANIAFWTRPQNSVAGDYYDAFYPNADAASGGKIMLVVADVAGKSVPAALLMATLQASLRTLASEGLELTDLALRLNRYACAYSLDGRRFTTAVIAEYDPSTRFLTYVNAGHNAPIIRRTNGGIDRLPASGLPFGILLQGTFSAGTAQLQSGDLLVFFTDGVVEALNSSNEEYSDPRWVNAIRNIPRLPAKESLALLMKQVEDFVGATHQSDDITCLLLHCQ